MKQKMKPAGAGTRRGAIAAFLIAGFGLAGPGASAQDAGKSASGGVNPHTMQSKVMKGAPGAPGTPAHPGDEGLRGHSPGEPRGDWSFSEAGLIPVQSGGRIKPLDSYARESVLFLTGSRSYKGWNPVDLVFSWVAFPEYWENQRIIKIGDASVRRQLLLPEDRNHFTPRELYMNPVLLQYANEGAGNTASPPIEKASRADPRKQERDRVFDRIMLFRGVATGHAWRVVPDATAPEPGADTPGEASIWGSLAPSDATGGKARDLIRERFGELIRHYYTGDREQFERMAGMVRATVEGELPAWTGVDRTHLAAEGLYNRVRPFQVAWILYLLSGMLWVAAMVRRSSASVGDADGAPAESRSGRIRSVLAMIVTCAAFLTHTAGFGLRMYISGRAPVTNMYESIVWVSFGIMIFSFVIYLLQKQKVIMAVAGVLAAFTLIAADLAPTVMDPGIHPLVPVLRSNYWLTIHVLTITLGYSALALSLGFGNIALYHFLRNKPTDRGGKRIGVAAKVANMNQLNYRSMQFGVVFLAAGTILGGIWADYSWGRFWGWDPKETWALIALLTYVALLHARYTAWVGQFGFAAWSVIGFSTVVMAWYGVNFVLGVGLHSYGFASGGYGPVATTVGIQLLFVGFCAIVHKRRKAKSPASERGGLGNSGALPIKS